jgi:hypothetical protein
MSVPSLSFSCPACQQQLSAPRELLGRDISCPSCQRTVTVTSAGGTASFAPAKAPKRSPWPQVFAGVVLLAMGTTGYFWLKGNGAVRGEAGQPPASSAGVPVNQQSALPTTNEPTGNPQVLVPSIKRSGAETWQVAESYFLEVERAKPAQISTQIKKGTLTILPGSLVIDQVADDVLLATHRLTREQWLLRPDNPAVLDEIAISEGLGVVALVGVYLGPEQVEMVSGAPRRLPCMVVFCAQTTAGFLNFENPAALKASASELKPFVEAQQKKLAVADANEKTEQDRRAAEREAQRAKDIAELEKDPAWNPDAKKQPVVPKVSEKVDTGELARAKADLASVTSKIESERKRFSDALETINTLTKNKTVAVREGTPAYFKCTEASKTIQEVEAGAPELKAEKARLETLVGTLDPEIQR